MDKEHYFIEDAFVVDDEGWIHMPGDKGKISPEGVVYDKDGEEMYVIYDEGEQSYKSTYYSDDLIHFYREKPGHE